jgi:putative phosphoribosyl transferase
VVLFRDRHEAGRALAALLHPYSGRGDVIVLALPRGGVPVGYEVARTLGVPLDVFLVRKLGVPGHEELAMGAIATGGVQFLNTDVVRAMHIRPEQIQHAAEREAGELRRRERAYRRDRPAPALAGRTVIVVDDGLATGATMHAAVRAIRGMRPARIVVAVPVGATDTCAALREAADEVVCAETPEPFYAVGMWYDRFDQTDDAEVRYLLADATASAGAALPP